MSKQKIAPTRGEGIPTPASVAETPKSGNSPGFSAAGFAAALDACILNEVVAPIGEAMDRLEEIEELCRIIDEEIGANALHGSRISALVKIALRMVVQLVEVLDTDQAALRDTHLPRLRALLPNGGEA